MAVIPTATRTTTKRCWVLSERPRLNYDLGDLERRLGLVAMYATIAEADYTSRRVRVEAGPILSAWLPWLTQRAQDDRTWHPPEVGEQVMVLAPHGELNQGCILGAIHAAEPESRTAPADRPTVDRTAYADGMVDEYDREASRRRTTYPDDTVIEYDATKGVYKLAFFDGTVIDYDASASIYTLSFADGTTMTVDAASGDVSADITNTLNANVATSATVTSPQMTLNGNVAINGSLTLAGPLAAGPGAQGGGVAIQGGVAVTQGDVVVQGISSITHTHPGDSGGTTGPPQ